MSINVFIPPDIIEEVLTRLPVKSVGQFKCVSKSWYKIISHPEFIKRHVKQSKSNTKLIIEATSFTKDIDTEKKLYDVDFTLYGEFSNLKEIKYPPMPMVSTNVIVTGCSNGVICLNMLNGKQSAFVLWNPSIRKHFILPKCYERNGHLFLGVDGFGYDEITDDYKLVRLVKCCSFYRSYIFSLKSKRWTWKDFSYEGEVYWKAHNGILANGALHWLLKDHYILAFNLGTETFQRLPPPKTSFEKPYLCQGILNGTHHLILHSGTEENWIMKDYSWSNLKLNILDGSQFLFMKPRYVSNNIEMYNYEKQSFEEIEWPVKGECFCSFLYFESLVALQD